MKHLFTLFFASLISLASFAQTPIPNGDFESFYLVGTTFFIDQWQPLATNVNSGGAVFFGSVDEGRNSDYAGLLSANSYLENRFAWSQRPAGIGAWVKGNVDSVTGGADLVLHYSAQSIPMGQVSYSIPPANYANWTYLHFPLPSAGPAIDSLVLQFTSWGPNSTLAIDDIEFTAATHVAERPVKEEGFTVSPNPAQDHISITFHHNARPAEITLMDLTGKEIFHSRPDGDIGDNTDLDRGYWPTGVYLLQVQWQDGRRQTSKVVLQ